MASNPAAASEAAAHGSGLPVEPEFRLQKLLVGGGGTKDPVSTSSVKGCEAVAVVASVTSNTRS